MCGAAGIVFVIVAMNYGLSPRVRGSQVASVLLSPSKRVYPRVCGAATTRRKKHMPYRGLSPRVRGSLVVGLYVAAELGSIPACAGQP